MDSRLRVTTALAILGASLLFGCAAPPRRSADIATQPPHPSPIDNFQIVVQNGVYRSGQPILAEKDNPDWQYLQSIGVTIVVRLNEFVCDKTTNSCVKNADEEIRLAKKHGIKVIPIYMPPDDWPINWNPWASPEITDIMRAVEILEKRGNEKVLVHCAHGKDRTGLVIAAYSVRNKNYCKDAAYAQMKYYGASSFLFEIKPVLHNENIVEKPNCSDGYVSTLQ